MTTQRPSIPCLLFILCFLSPSVALAAEPIPQNPNIFNKIFHAVSGYYKSLNFISKTKDTEEGLFGALQRLRVEVESKFTDNLSMNLVYDHEALFNDFANTGDFSLIRQEDLGDLSFWDTDKVISDTDHVYERHLLNRAFLTFQSERSRWIVGKQLIDWGRMRGYSPLDIFNPPSPTDLEPEERIGFDALNAEWFFGAAGSLNFIFGPGHDSQETSFGLKVAQKVGTYDVNILIAKKEKDKTVGVGFDGYIKNAGFRGEFSYTKSGDEHYPRAAIGMDYNFPHQIYAFLEYFYNGAANGNYDTYVDSLVEQRHRLSLEKHLLSLLLTHDLTPLVKLKGFLVYDVVGESVFFNPEVRYNIKENLDAACGAQLYAESQGSEFENSQNLYYVEVKYFF
jgi:hypothetical protein